MKFKKIRLTGMILLLTAMLVIPSIVVNAEQLVDPDIPDSWYEEFKTAGEWDIEEFSQSPILEERVEKGELPAVEERLPVYEDILVIEPYAEVGEYGGTANIFDEQLDYYEFWAWNYSAGTQYTPDGQDEIPFYIKDWEYSNNHQDITLYLREGLKWSDGEPFTAEDYLYWWEHFANVEELQPVSPEKWDPPLIDVTSEDELTVTFHYGEPNPFFHRFDLTTNLGAFNLGPAHYMEQFHPDFVGEETVKEMAADVGLERWDEYYMRVQEDSPSHPEYEHQRPVLSSYVVVDRTETTMIAERNPYYPFVDPEGKQLPYVDKVRVNLATEAEIVKTKAITGEATTSVRYLQTHEIPMYKKNEEKESYTTLLYRRLYGSDCSIQLNLTHEDPDLRDLFQNVDFRKALSLGIDRESINDKVYYGQGIARQNTVLPTDEFYKEEYARAYADYDPDRAEEILDEIGMVDENDDGYRELPNGEKFNPTLLYCLVGPVDPTPILEMTTSQWDKIGLDVDLKMVSRELHNTRANAGNFDIHVWTTPAFPFANPYKHNKSYAPVSQPGYSSWPGWVNWHTTDGEEGVEPPALVKDLIDASLTLSFSPDPDKRAEAKEFLVRAQAENLWTIGTVGLSPQPLIIKNNLKNVPVTGMWDSDLGYLNLQRPEQFYLEE